MMGRGWKVVVGELALAVLLGTLIAMSLITCAKAEDLFRVTDDNGSGNYAEFDLDTVAELQNAPGAFGGIAMRKSKDGKIVLPTLYVVLAEQCNHGEGVLVWLDDTGEVIGAGPYDFRHGTSWLTRAAQAICSRVHGT